MPSLLNCQDAQATAILVHTKKNGKSNLRENQQGSEYTCFATLLSTNIRIIPRKICNLSYSNRILGKIILFKRQWIMGISYKTGFTLELLCFCTQDH